MVLFAPSPRHSLRCLRLGIDGRAGHRDTPKHGSQSGFARLGSQWPFDLLGYGVQLLPYCTPPRPGCDQWRRMRGCVGRWLPAKHKVGFPSRRILTRTDRCIQVCSIGPSIQMAGFWLRMTLASLSMPTQTGKLVIIISSCLSAHRLLPTVSPEAKAPSWLC